MAWLAALRFILELCGLAGLVTAGSHLGWWAAIAAPALMAAVWGALIAPKAPWRLADPGRLAAELAIFLLVGGALTAAGQAMAAVVLTVASAAVAIAVRVTKTPA